MKYYLCRLLPGRPTFAQDMTDAERQVMGAHAAYLTGLGEQGIAVVFGPVADPKGMWGVGIFELEDDMQIESIIENDPAVKAAIGLHYEILPMLRAVIGKRWAKTP